MLSFTNIMALIFLCLFLFKKIRLSTNLFISSFVILLTLIGSKQIYHGAVAFIYARQKYLFLQTYWCLVSSCMFLERYNIASLPFQPGQSSFTVFSFQWYVMYLYYIILFALLWLVNIATFVVVLWLFWFGVCLACLLLHYLYHTHLERRLLHILTRSIPLNLQTVLLHLFFLCFFENNFLFFFSFMWDLEVICLL